MLEPRKSAGPRKDAPRTDLSSREIQDFFGPLPVAIVGIDDAGRVVLWNPAAERLYGWKKEEVLGQFNPTVPPSRRKEFDAMMPRFMREDGFEVLETRRRRKEGTELDVRISILQVKSEGGRRIAIAMIQDIGDAAKSKDLETRYLRLLAQSSNLIIVTDPEGRIEYVNPKLLEVSGYGIDEVIGKNPRIFRSKTTSPEKHRALWEAVREGKEWQGEFENSKKSGEPYWVRSTVAPVKDASGKTTHLLAVQEDVTEIKKAERSAAERESFYKQIIENSMDVIAVLDAERRYEYVSSSATLLLGYEPAELVGTKAFERFHPSDVPSAGQAVEEAFRHPGEPRFARFRIRHKDGTWRTLEGLGKFIPGAKGTGRFVISARDVTERMRMEDRVDELTAAVNQSGALITTTGLSGRIQYANEKFVRSMGLEAANVIGRTWEELGFVSPEVFQEIGKRVKAGREWRGELRRKDKDGKLRVYSAVITPTRDRQGRLTGAMGVEEDVTERRELEVEYRQAQKMESVGRLAGGVAHDFNNLLTAILGSCSFLLDEFALTDPRRRDLEEIEKAAQMAAGLTRQLLLFSRQQPVEPQVLRLDELVGGMERLIRRLIGEDIELASEPTEPVRPIEVDPGQMEQVIVNMVVNARDAMPKGGRISLGVKEVGPDQDPALAASGLPRGRYVRLSIADNGSGMTEEVKARIFEPFFTTKERGKGTGLGLATCYGIVKQNGGSIACESQVGKGTTFKIYVPAVDGAPLAPAPKPDSPRPGGQETILLVEDDAPVRQMAERILTRQGYKVLAARDGGEALALLEEASDGIKIDLLFTDVVMPRMYGTDLAEVLRGRNPALKVLFSSGYTDSTADREAMEREGIFLAKPYTSAGLADKIREVLDRGPGKKPGITPA